MDPHVNLQVAELVETFLTNVASVLPLRQVITAHVVLQDGETRVLFVTQVAGQLLRCGVGRLLVSH